MSHGPSMRLRTMLGLALLVLATAAAPARADPLTPEQKAAVEALIRDTIANHPEIVIDALKTAQLKDRFYPFYLWHAQIHQDDIRNTTCHFFDGLFC